MMRRQRSDDRGRAGGAVSPVRFRRAEKSLRRDFARRRPRFAEPESSFVEGPDTAARIGRRHPNPLFVPSFGTFFSGEVPDSRIFFLSLQANCGGTKTLSTMKVCEITGKVAVIGNNVSHSNRKTKRKFSPNLKTKRFWSEEEGRWITLKVSAAGMKTINKKGLAVALREAACPKKIY